MTKITTHASTLSPSLMLMRYGLIVLLCALSGCASLAENTRLDGLDAAIQSYSKAIRWGEFRAAVRHIRFRDEEKQRQDPSDLKSVRVTAYDVRDKGFAETEDEAKVAAEIGFYHRDDGIVRTFMDHQTWWYDEESKQWFLDGDLPDFTAALYEAQ